MRILFDARVLSGPARHGIARHAKGLLSALAAQPGRHSFIVLAAGPTSLEAIRGKEGFETIWCRIRPYSLAEQLLLPWRLAWLKFDLYYSPTYLPPRLSFSPQVFTIHDLIHLDFAADYPFSRQLAWRMIVAAKARRARAVLTVSEATASQIASRLRVDPGRIVVIGNGLDEAFRPRLPEEVARIRSKLNLGGDYIVVLGNRRSHKNLPGALAAFQRLAAGWPGRGQAAPALVVVGSQAGLPAGPGRIVAAPVLDDHELAALYSGARAMLFPSLAEGFGLPPLEALACGCPVVVSEIPALREVLGPESAFLVQPGDEAGLAEGMKQALAEPAVARAKVEAGKRRAAEFTWAKAAGRLLALFDHLEIELRKQVGR